MSEQFTGKVIAEKYRIDSYVKSGEAGDLYRGRHLFMDKPVMIKILPSALGIDDEIRRRFTTEAKNTALYMHPNVLGVSDFGTERDGTSYIVFESGDGETLKQVLTREGRFSVGRAVITARQIAAALSAAHEKGFIHANLTPDSILIDNPPNIENVKVFDFASSPEDARRRNAGRRPGNVAYLAPEQSSGLRPVDARTDIYSLGIILYQMLAGEVPFVGETPTDVMLKHAEEPVPPLSSIRKDVPQSLMAAIEKSLSKDPDRRFQSASEFADELDRVAASIASGGNNLWKTAAIVIAGISVLAVAMIWATSTKQTNPTTQLRPDANAQPVQPINPATGAEEQSLAGMPGPLTDLSNVNSSVMAQPPGTLPGGDNYNPWATGAPPAGAPPPYFPPGGETYTVDPNSPSPFTQDAPCILQPSGIYLCPVPNATPVLRPSPTPKTPANANVSASPTPSAAQKPSPTPAAPVKPNPTPATSKTPKTATGNEPEKHAGDH